MDRLIQYRQIIKDTLKEYARLFNQQPEGVDVLAVCDEEIDTYALINVGWNNDDRLDFMSVMMRIINGKIWMEKEETMYDFLEELLRAGVPRQDIVFGNVPEKMRPYTGFAVG